jgi:hypothetical protein
VRFCFFSAAAAVTLVLRGVLVFFTTDFSAAFFEAAGLFLPRVLGVLFVAGILFIISSLKLFDFKTEVLERVSNKILSSFSHKTKQATQAE